MVTPQKTSDLQSALQRLGVDALLVLYISIINSEAERAVIEEKQPQEKSNPYGPILGTLNAFRRSLRRSKLTSDKITTKLSALPQPALPFIRLELMRRLDREIDIEKEDWSKT